MNTPPSMADDFMFCKVMQDKDVCKTFLEMTLAGQIGKITELSSQNAIFAGAEAKSVRLDIFVKDENGKTYDIEMRFSDRHPCLSENFEFWSKPKTRESIEPPTSCRIFNK